MAASALNASLPSLVKDDRDQRREGDEWGGSVSFSKIKKKSIKIMYYSGKWISCKLTFNLMGKIVK